MHILFCFIIKCQILQLSDLIDSDVCEAIEGLHEVLANLPFHCPRSFRKRTDMTALKKALCKKWRPSAATGGEAAVRGIEVVKIQ